MWLSPKNTFESVAATLVDGLSNGSIALRNQPEIRVVPLEDYFMSHPDRSAVLHERIQKLQIGFSDGIPLADALRQLGV